jgi:lipopolysaccharide transport system ATP-binding protein
MSDIAIRVENLSKQYQIGSLNGNRRFGYQSLRDTITDAFTSPFRRARSLLRGQAYGASEMNETIWALRDDSFEIKRGEVVGIIGRNGAGKSTLLKILSRITEPTGGQVAIYGRIGSLLEVGTGFHPELTGRENIYLNGAILGMRRAEIERQFDAIVDFSGVEKFIDTPVKHYSSGMYLRLAFSVAAHLDTAILLVDEVLAVGDAAFQKRCLGKMKNITHKGRTVLFVSHDMQAIQKLCSRCVLLEEGQIVLDSEARLVVERYLQVRSSDDQVVRSLGSLPRLSGRGELIRLVKGWIVNPKGKPVNKIRFGEPFTVYIEALAYRKIEYASVTVGISTFDEYRIVTVTSENAGILYSVEPSETLCVGTTFDDLVLRPGLYLITVGIGSLDHLPEAMPLEVLSLSTGIPLPNPNTFGMVHVTANWKRIDK